MLRTLLSLLGAAPLLLAAQTYYYVNSIGVSPPAPTAADPVTITLFGDLSASNSYIISTSSNVVGGQVQLTVNAGSQGIGAPVLVPHSESFNLGTLQAGIYTITIGGSSTGDFAPAVEHQFTVSGGGGGSPCDSLTLSPLAWHPFTDTALVLTASNASSVLFDYPGFLLLDPQGDTLAMEQVNYFGIGQGPQTHVLTVHPGASIPPGTFTGDLELWTGFYQTPGCTWTEAFDPCPPVPCAPLSVTVTNTGFSLVNASFNWTVTDDQGGIVGTGTLALIGNVQVDSAFLCMPPGAYELALVQAAPFTGQVAFGVSAAQISGPEQVFVQGGTSNVLPFALYPACFSGTNGLGEVPAAAELSAWAANGLVHVRVADGAAIGALRVFDAQGRTRASERTLADRCVLDLRNKAAGMIFVERTAPDGGRSVKRMILVP
jgi:hypothetical protein